MEDQPCYDIKMVGTGGIFAPWGVQAGRAVPTKRFSTWRSVINSYPTPWCGSHQISAHLEVLVVNEGALESVGGHAAGGHTAKDATPCPDYRARQHFL